MTIANKHEAKLDISARENKYDAYTDMALLNEVLEDLSEEGMNSAQKLNEEITIMRNGIREKLWMAYKELRNDYNKYITVWSKISSALRDGYYEGLYDNNGNPIPQYKPNEEQHAILTAVRNRFNMTMEDCEKLAKRAEERYSRRANQSGTSSERSEFEPSRQSKDYARKDNEQGISDMELKRFVAQNLDRFKRSTIKESMEAIADELLAKRITKTEADALYERLKRIS